MKASTRKLKPPERFILDQAALGIRVVAARAYENHSSVLTGELWIGVPEAGHRSCVAAGWLSNDRITEAGRRALAADKRQRK